jgi:hypothetical protein
MEKHGIGWNSNLFYCGNITITTTDTTQAFFNEMVFYFLNISKICNEEYDESTFPFTFGLTFND